MDPALPCSACGLDLLRAAPQPCPRADDGLHQVGGVPRRPDGWPLCPVCGEDELADLGAGSSPGRKFPDGAWRADPDEALFCYRCGRVTMRGGRPLPVPA